MDSVQLAVIAVLVLLLSNGDAGKQKVLKRSKRNHVSCGPKSLVRYRLTVHTLWSRETFPKMFPTYRPHAQWSSLVGRTHGSEYEMWTEGAHSTMGVKKFAEQGDPSQLNIESFQGYGDILDSFVAPPVNTSVGQTAAVIFLDGHHSKLSFMMKIIPSPDWFVGVNSLDLCANGRWRNKVHVDLRPFDAGSDQGLTFTAPNWPNTPPLPISAITSSFPDHPASSFLYPDYEELPRLAFLELDIVSEFRHRETFINIHQDYKTSAGDNDETNNSKKTKIDEMSTTTIDMESKIAKLQSAIPKRNDGSASGATNDDPSVNEDISDAVNLNGLSKTRWINAKGEQVSEVKDRVLKTKDVKEDKMYIHNKTDAISGPVMHKAEEINNLPLNGLSENTVEETSAQYKTEGHDDNNLERSTKTQINVTGYTAAGESDSTLHTKEVSAGEHNKKTSKISPIFSMGSLLRGFDRSHLKSDGMVPTPQTTSISTANQNEHLLHETSSKNMASMHGSPLVDCEVGEWSEWGPCSQTCGFGQQERSRDVSNYPQNGGSTCPRLRQTNICGSMRNCEWKHFSFLDPNVTKRQLREGPTRHRTAQRKKLSEGLH